MPRPRRLKFPLTLAFVVVSSACGSSPSFPDAGLDAAPGPDVPQPAIDAQLPDADDTDAGPLPDAHSNLFCVATGPLPDGGTCPLYADEHGNCPAGCEPVS